MYPNSLVLCGECGREVPEVVCHVVCGPIPEDHVMFCPGHCPRCNPVSLFDHPARTRDVKVTKECV
jgi:hypothetical protein